MRESRRCYGDVHDDFRALASDREAPEAAALPLLLTELLELGLVLDSKAERSGVADMFAFERPGQKLSELGQTNGEIVTAQRARLHNSRVRGAPGPTADHVAHDVVHVGVWGVKTWVAPLAGSSHGDGRAGASDPALAKMPSPATVGDVVATAGGPAQPGFLNVVIPEGSVTLGSGRDERAGHGLDRVCAPHRLNPRQESNVAHMHRVID